LDEAFENCSARHFQETTLIRDPVSVTKPHFRRHARQFSLKSIEPSKKIASGLRRTLNG
jgi:hypothetical protein